MTTNTTNSTQTEKTEQSLATQPQGLKFSEDFKGDSMEIGHGEYNRKFLRTDEPFVVKDEEEERLLLNTGHFMHAESPATTQANSRQKLTTGNQTEQSDSSSRQQQEESQQ